MGLWDSISSIGDSIASDADALASRFKLGVAGIEDVVNHTVGDGTSHNAADTYAEQRAAEGSPLTAAQTAAVVKVDDLQHLATAGSEAITTGATLGLISRDTQENVRAKVNAAAHEAGQEIKKGLSSPWVIAAVAVVLLGGGAVVAFKLT